MAKRDNPVLGTIQCDGCGGTASVHQARRGSGRFLYTRCGECGADQRTGKAVQTRLYNQTEWRAGADPVKPPNVAEKSVVEPSEPSKHGGSGDIGGSGCTTENEPDTTEIEPAEQPATTKKKWAPLAFLGMVAAGLLAFAS
ncbi:hypothetical protein [Alkalimarinus coralli]|uniref:hypothetical protein n=1 Tax=Alkalimarinus coralli TaxID=2935863 RepID=UPI00202B33BC|nr:hypothetical protein [Alkalimarinus coralli]